MSTEIEIALRLAKGYWLQPWNSPYLRWRMETWSGIHADSITPKVFLRFSWQHRKEIWRYLHWAAQESGN